MHRFLPNIFINGEANEPWGLQDTGMHSNEKFCFRTGIIMVIGTTMIGAGDIKHDVPTTFCWGTRPHLPPPRGGAHANQVKMYFGFGC